MSNKELGARIPTEEEKDGVKISKPQSVSMVEKRISRLKKAKLIMGWEERERLDGTWTTSCRHLQLDPEIFAFSKIAEQDQRIYAAKLQAINEDIDKLHPELRKMSEEPPEPPPQQYRLEVRFD